MELILWAIGIFVTFIVIKVILGFLAPITVTASKLFDSTLSKNGIDHRTLKPSVKEDIVRLSIDMSSFGANRSTLELKAMVAKYVESAAVQIANYIKGDATNEDDPFIKIFNNHHHVNEFKRQ
ncbi:hypothetical protein [Vibrio sp. 10N]|uniref:hypothetical protein n=1 Tax=Vibrio sp. 10N TaxID=3058938 RepID=UPI002813A7A9|nr:hypothetical protein VB10N_36680 [Vibrio sp. 10N]